MVQREKQTDKSLGNSGHRKSDRLYNIGLVTYYNIRCKKVISLTEHESTTNYALYWAKSESPTSI